MKLKELLTVCADTLGIKLDFDDPNHGETCLLVRLANFVFCDVAVRVPLYNEEEATSDAQGRIYYADLAERLHTVTSIKQGDRAVSYNARPTYIELMPNCKVTLTYAYMPKNVELSDELPFRDARFDERTLCYGINAEYNLVSGSYDEAREWQSRYEYALRRITEFPTRYLKGRVLA